MSLKQDLAAACWFSTALDRCAHSSVRSRVPLGFVAEFNCV